MSRFLRKHWPALLAIAVCNFVFFFPVIFMGRVVSPNDVFYSYAPWSASRPDITHPQNLLMNDPPTSYYTMLSMVKSDWRVFHWNPYIACGIPGFGSSAASSLTPLVLLPVLLVPLTWTYTAIIFLKLNVAFLFAYLWLREEKLGRRGAAIGAIVIAAAGVYSVRWLWQVTNATVFYPALLWIVRRTFNGRKTSIALVALIALSYAVVGFPSAMAYGAWLALAYAVFLGIRSRRLRGFGRVATGVIIALLLAVPTLVPFAQFLKRSGYLAARQTTSLSAIFPPTHWGSFIDANRLGNPTYKNWHGDPTLGVLNNYVEATIYLGILALLLAVLGLFNAHARARWFWLAAALLILGCMFGFPGVSNVFANLPGFKYSALARAGLLLPLAAGYLAAAGGERLVLWIRRFPSLRALVAGALAIGIAFDLGLLAGRFHPYLDPKDADVPTTPVIDFLQHERTPFRVAPFFDYFWPNSAELFRIQDVRSHFGSEGDYRRLLQRLDKDVWNGRSTVLQFNSLNYNFTDPLGGMLGVRYYLEHKYIDIIKWGIFAATQPGVKNLGPIALKPGAVMERTVAIDTAPFWAIEIPAAVESGNGVIEVTLLKNGAALWTRRFTKDEANVMNKLYVPVHGNAQPGDVVTLRVRSIGVKASLNGGENGFYYGRVTTPVIFDRELPDGRVFRNLAELPRFWSVTKFRKLNRDEFLAARDVDFANEAVITDDPVMPPAAASPARVTLKSYEPHEQRVITESPAPMFLASSEKRTPELAVMIDGRPARAIEINMLFAGVRVPAGRHEVVFSRRIARGWWWAPILGAILWVAAAAWELTSSLRRRRSDTRTVPATAA